MDTGIRTIPTIELYVSAAQTARVRARRRLVAGLLHLHLHHQVFGLAAQLVRFLRLLAQHRGGQSEEQAGQHGQRERPRQHIELGVHQPVLAVGIAAEHADA